MIPAIFLITNWRTNANDQIYLNVVSFHLQYKSHSSWHQWNQVIWDRGINVCPAWFQVLNECFHGDHWSYFFQLFLQNSPQILYYFRSGEFPGNVLLPQNPGKGKGPMHHSCVFWSCTGASSCIMMQSHTFSVTWCFRAESTVCFLLMAFFKQWFAWVLST